MPSPAPPTPLERAAAMLDPSRLSGVPDTARGYLDLVGDSPPPAQGPSARLMRTKLYPLIYEPWRALALRLLTGLSGMTAGEERKLALKRLELSPGQVVLDVACGPGNFTEHFGRQVGETGLAIGLDASETMLAQAVRDHATGSVAYLRADAAHLPFADGSVDAACCFAALYLMAEPHTVLTELARVVRPGGRLAILTSYPGHELWLRAATSVSGVIGGLTFFGGDEITGALEQAGLVDIEQTITGVAQFVSARAADRPPAGQPSAPA